MLCIYPFEIYTLFTVGYYPLWLGIDRVIPVVYPVKAFTIVLFIF